MRLRTLLSTLFVGGLLMASAEAGTWPRGRPKLVVVIVIDQFRSDDLSRFDSKFSDDGFRALTSEGAYYPYGEYEVLHSMTGPGHATILSGAYPYQMGIPLNDWYDQKTKSSQYCVEDSNHKTVGAPTKEKVGTSPKNLIGTTVGDELKNAGLRSRVVSISLKDRSAILMGGHRADLALWFDGGAKKWVSSTYYLKSGQVPAWVQRLNQDSALATCDQSEVCGAEITGSAFEAALTHEKLGKGPDTDLIALSFSGHDYCGHKHGPNSPEVEAVTIAEDKLIAKIRKILAQHVSGGLKNVLFVLSSDHGVAPAPEFLKDTGVDSGRIDEGALRKEIEATLSQKCGSSANAKWIPLVQAFNYFVDEGVVARSKCSQRSVETEIKRILSREESFAHVQSASDYADKKLPPQFLGSLAEKTFYPGRTGHVVAIPKPFFINSSKNLANHMTGYTYDRMVPIILSGYGIKPGLRSEKARVVDIAPTLSFILGITPPALSEGRVLTESLLTD